MNWKCWFFHDYSKWENTFYGIESCDDRHCKRKGCKVTQEKWFNET